MNTKGKIAIAVVITAFISSAATLAVSGIASVLPSKDAAASMQNKLNLINMILDEKYLYSYDANELGEAAVKAYVDALDEPYTEYYTAKEFSEYQDNLKDGYVGIGIIVGVNDNDEIEVIAPFEGSPAYNAGILPGDILKAVDGVSYSGAELSDAVSVIRGGGEGTFTDITVSRGGEETTYTIERSDISDKSVYEEMMEDGIGYIRISQFNMDSEDGSHSTSTEFRDKLAALKEQGMERLIIDLRDNPGGLLTEVCDIADMLLPEGTITYIEDKNGERKTYSSDADFVDIPMVVLINGNSASASEVLTGSLKDYDAAVIVGETSYGKGIVQDVYTLLDGSGISLTTSKYYTPSGVCIHEVGIEPDVMVEAPEQYRNTYASMIPEAEDTQLKKAVEIIKEK